MAFQALFAISGDLISKSWTASKKAYKNGEEFRKVEAGDTVFFAFRPSYSVKDWFAPANESLFGKIEMKRDQFPCMRSIGNNIDATVNEAFLKNLKLLIAPKTSFATSVEKAIKSKKSVVFTGHSSGGAIAILATVWYLETNLREFPNGFPEPLCVTFGAPLVGDYIFKHALGRENWSRFFFNFVNRFDIIPRIMLAQKASIDADVLRQLDHPRSSNQENDQSITKFYTAVMKDASKVAYKAACELTGKGEEFLETFSSFLELSPYRPVGTFVFSTDTRLVSVSNSDAILQILFYASQSSNSQDGSLIPNQSVRDHGSYEELVQSMGRKSFDHLDLQHLPLDDGQNSIVSALNDLGLSTRARQCVRAALEAEKQLLDNQGKINTKLYQSKINTKLPTIEKNLRWIEKDYKQTHKNGCYDSFKASSEDIDFDANVKRAELAGIFDELLGLVKKGQLPDGFEGRTDWIELATRYRRLVEPLDIANYYQHIKNEDTGPYMGKGRPSRYIYAHRGYEHDQWKRTGRMIGEDAFWSKVKDLQLGSEEEMQEKLKISGSKCGSCFWAEVEELRGKEYIEVEVRVKTLEALLEGWIEDEEVDVEQIFLEGSTFRKWWNHFPRITSSLLRCEGVLSMRQEPLEPEKVDCLSYWNLFVCNKEMLKLSMVMFRFPFRMILE